MHVCGAPFGRACLVVAVAASLVGCGEVRQDQRPPASSDTPPERPVDEPETFGSTPDEAPATPPTAEARPDHQFEIEVRGGLATGGPIAMRVRRGDDVRITIRSDAADEVHLHGVDKQARVPARGAAELSFTATAQGSYELELHDAGTVLGTLVVG